MRGALRAANKLPHLRICHTPPPLPSSLGHITINSFELKTTYSAQCQMAAPLCPRTCSFCTLFWCTQSWRHFPHYSLDKSVRRGCGICASASRSMWQGGKHKNWLHRCVWLTWHWTQNRMRTVRQKRTQSREDPIEVAEVNLSYRTDNISTTFMEFSLAIRQLFQLGAQQLKWISNSNRGVLEGYKEGKGGSLPIKLDKS